MLELSLDPPMPQVQQQLFGSPGGKSRSKSPSRQINASASAASPPASPAPHKADAAPPSAAHNDDASLTSGMQNTADIVQLSKLPASQIRPAIGSPVRRGGNGEARGAWKSAATSGPPPGLKWSPTVERLIMNSTQQVD